MFYREIQTTDSKLKSHLWKERISSVQFSRSVMSDSATPWIAARQASLSITNSWSSFKLMSIKSVMPSSHLILCRPLLLLPPIPPSIRVFSNESTLHMRWPKYWGFSFSRSQIHRDRKKNGGYQGLGDRGMGGLLFNGYKVSVLQDEEF